MKAYAKVNFSLEITGRLENGYHTLRSVMQAVDLFDEVTVEARAHHGAPKLSVRMIPDDGIIPAGETNLAYRAAALMAELFTDGAAGKFRDIDMTVEKRIPVAAGLAGGSTDAAAVMLALAERWGVDVSLAELCKLSAALGADVPFCLAANAKNNPGLYANDPAATSTALAEGIGDILTPLPSLAGAVILVKPNISLSTPHIYGVYDEAPEKAARPDTDGFLRALRDGGITAKAAPALETFLVNALEYAALSESTETARILAELKNLLPRAAVFLSGSGPTVAAYFPEPADAKAAFPAARERFGAEDAEVFFARIL
jgi:4-diphosphocytidyl-2-C-methyl-D-erythritol kinase